MYKITLSDGYQLDNLELNGNNFISNTIIPDTVFENNLKTVEVFDGENTQILTDQFLAANRVENNQTWFVLIDKTPEMKREEEMTDLQLALVELYESLLGGV